MESPVMRLHLTLVTKVFVKVTQIWRAYIKELS